MNERNCTRWATVSPMRTKDGLHSSKPDLPLTPNHQGVQSTLGKKSVSQTSCSFNSWPFF